MTRKLAFIAVIFAAALAVPFGSVAGAAGAPAPRYCSGCIGVPVLEYVQQKPSDSSSGQTVFWHYSVTGRDLIHQPAPGQYTQDLCTVFTVFNTGTTLAPVFVLKAVATTVGVSISGVPGWPVRPETVWGGDYPPAGGTLALASVSCQPYPITG